MFNYLDHIYINSIYTPILFQRDTSTPLLQEIISTIKSMPTAKTCATTAYAKCTAIAIIRKIQACHDTICQESTRNYPVVRKLLLTS